MQKMKAKLIGLVLLGILLPASLWHCTSSTTNSKTVVFAASSLTEYATALAQAYREQTGELVQLSFAASSTLARQIESGAPADLFLSANPDWASFLENKLDPKPLTRNYLGNRMVLVGKVGLALPENIQEWQPMAGRIAIGNPDHVPAGQYAAMALKASGTWERLAPQMVPTANVREALRLVLKGEVDWALVYASDAKAAGLASVALPLPANQKVIYTAMCLSCERNQGARRFYEFLFSSRARTTADTMGFQWSETQ